VVRQLGADRFGIGNLASQVERCGAGWRNQIALIQGGIWRSRFALSSLVRWPRHGTRSHQLGSQPGRHHSPRPSPCCAQLAAQPRRDRAGLFRQGRWRGALLQRFPAGSLVLMPRTPASPSAVVGHRGGRLHQGQAQPELVNHHAKGPPGAAPLRWARAIGGPSERQPERSAMDLDQGEEKRVPNGDGAMVAEALGVPRSPRSAPAMRRRCFLSLPAVSPAWAGCSSSFPSPVSVPSPRPGCATSTKPGS